MTTPLVTITPETSAQEAIRVMIEKRIKRLPVVTPDGPLIGLVGRDGLMRKILQMRPAKTTE
jgi:CBS domain-containing protein